MISSPWVVLLQVLASADSFKWQLSRC